MKNFILINIISLISIVANAQNVGIGEINPTESKLQIKTIDSAGLIVQNTATPNLTKTAMFYKSDNNYSGSIATVKTAFATYRMGLYTFGGSLASALKERLSILDNGNVGVGTITPTAKLEVAGTLKIADGTQGANKILTSDAGGNASWVNAAFGNVERFQYAISSTFINPIALSTGYNYGTTTTTYTAGANNFKINFTKSGLYHFDIHFDHVVSGNVSITGNSPITNEVGFTAGNKSFYGYVPFYSVTSGTSSASSYDKSLDVYIAAPDFFYIGCTKQANNIGYNIIVTGHLIAE